MGYYTVWVVGRSPLEIVEQYDESNDISSAFPGLTFDYIGDVEEQGTAQDFATFSDEDFPFAVVTAECQIVADLHPGSQPNSRVLVGTDEMRRFLESHPDEVITPMNWHN